jgi:hypothetical protein
MPPQCTSYSIRPLHLRNSGEDDDFHVPLLMYTASPCDYKRRGRASFKGGRSGRLLSSPTFTIIVTLSAPLSIRLNRLLL